MPSNPPAQKSGLPRTKRYKTSIACTACRRRKLKCDGLRPACSRCQKKDILRETCTYAPVTNDSNGSMSHPLAVTTLSPHPPFAAGSTLLEEGRPDAFEARDTYAEGNLGQFTYKVKNTIDAKMGLPPAKKRCPIPMIDAPLFEPHFPRQTNRSDLCHVDKVLPPRKHADHLMSLYWRIIEPLEPLLDQEHFSRSYHNLFTGGELDCDEHIFISTLNAIFALSTQLQESTPPEQRDEASSVFFQRAWSLLRPETILWEPASLELVQCLLLVSRYLQCTKNSHQTWMTVGSALRLAQSINLHVPDKPSLNSNPRDVLLRRQIWQCCVFMDRCLWWVFGRASMVPMTASSPSISSLHGSSDLVNPYDETSAHYSIKMLELDEITNHIILSQVLPRLYQNIDLNAILRIDNCLNKWEDSLPPSLQFHFVNDGNENGLDLQQVNLRLRIAHARVLLFRPMLARFCLLESQAARAPDITDQGLEDRILKECAKLCVENSQKMITLMYENCRPNVTVEIFPWWYRVFYLYISSQQLIAAMLRPDVFNPMVLDSWNKAMSALRAHNHLSSSIQRCISSFETMWQKVTNLGGDQAPLYEGFSNISPQDIIQHLGPEAENPLFDIGSIPFLGNVDWNT